MRKTKRKIVKGILICDCKSDEFSRNGSSSNNTSESKDSGINSSISEMRDLNQEIKNSGIPDSKINKYQELGDEDMKEVKILMSRYNPKFMAHLLKI